MSVGRLLTSGPGCGRIEGEGRGCIKLTTPVAGVLNDKLFWKVMDKTLEKALTRFPLDSIVLFKGNEIGKVIGYKRANGKDEVEVIYQHFPHLALGRQSMFSLRARNYQCKDTFGLVNK